MRLSKEIFDNHKKTCYQEKEGDLSAFIVEPREGISEKRLSMALNLILSEKDVIDYFASGDHSLPNNQ